jgi:hypothetical protein
VFKHQTIGKIFDMHNQTKKQKKLKSLPFMLIKNSIIFFFLAKIKHLGVNQDHHLDRKVMGNRPKKATMLTMRPFMGQCPYLHLSLGISILFNQGHVYDICVSHDINLVNNVND